MDLNDQVQVVLTKCGADIINKGSRSMNETYSHAGISWKDDYKEGDVYKGSLWKILGRFTTCYQVGHEAPFTQLEKINYKDDTPQQIYVFIDKQYQNLFNEIVQECNIQIINEDTCEDMKCKGLFYTLQFADVNEVYWFGRNYQNAINEYHKTV